MSGRPLQVVTQEQRQGEEDYERNREAYGQWCADCHDVAHCSHEEDECPYLVENLFAGAVDVYRRTHIMNYELFPRETCEHFFRAGYEARGNREGKK